MISEVQKYIVQRIIEVLSVDEIINYADVKRIGDNIDEQIQNVIICGISSINKVYPMTQDYEYKLDIAIRSWIADDLNGEGFDYICKCVRNLLLPLNGSFKSIFESPIVGVVGEAQTKQITEDSNILTLSFLIYASF